MKSGNTNFTLDTQVTDLLLSAEAFNLNMMLYQNILGSRYWGPKFSKFQTNDKKCLNVPIYMSKLNSLRDEFLMNCGKIFIEESLGYVHHDANTE
jgi:hypothetical protein